MYIDTHILYPYKDHNIYISGTVSHIIPQVCHLQQGSPLIALVRFPVRAIAKNAGSHSDAAAKPAWFWNTRLGPFGLPWRLTPAEPEPPPSGHKKKVTVSVDDGIFLFFDLNESTS